MSFGLMAVDWHDRIDFDRMREERVKRAKEQVHKHNLGSVLTYDYYNIRYLTSTFIGMWARTPDFLRYAVLPDGGEPYIFEMGSAAIKEKMVAPWLGDRIRPAVSSWRGGITGTGAEKKCAQGIKKILEDNKVSKEPVGLDLGYPNLIKALEDEGLEVVDGNPAMWDARVVKTGDEIECHKVIAMMVDAVYDKIRHALRPGVRENDLVAIANHALFTMGADDVEAVNSISGPRTNPNWHDFSDRTIRPGDMVFMDIMAAYNGYRSCYYRTFCCGTATEEQKALYKQAYDWIEASIDVIKPGITTADIAKTWPGPNVWGLNTETEAFANCVGHGIGLGLHEPPLISRAYSLDNPWEIKENMVLAVETYAGPKGGKHGVRIEEMVVVTEKGHEVISRYPIQEIPECPLI